MIETKNENIDEAFKLLTGAEKKFINTYIESQFDKIKAVKATIKPGKIYSKGYFEVKAHAYLNRESIKNFLSLYFKNLRLNHESKVNKLINHLESILYNPEDNQMKPQALTILSKYFLEIDNKKTSLSLTDTSGQVIKVEYV